jgi:outer membrane protein OmpA-like peptidoglycan-associated protein
MTNALKRCLLAALLATLATTARAQVPPFDVERLLLDPTAQGSLVVGNGETLEPRTFRLSITGHYEKDPFVVTDKGDMRGRGLFSPDDVAVHALEHRLTFHVNGALALAPRVEVHVRFPIVAWQQGDDAQLDESGVTAPALGLRVGVLKASATQPYSVAVASDVSPEWKEVFDLGGNEGATFTPRIEIGRRSGSGTWLLAAQAGAILRTEKIFLANDDTLQHEATAGLAWATAGAPLRYEVSARGVFDLEGQGVNAELLGGLRYALGRNAEVYALAGPGFSSKPGTPTYRGLVGVAFAPGKEEAPKPAAAPPPPPPPPDPCAPGQAQPVEQCPDLDADGDGIPNGQDRCPREAGIAATGGCPPRDSDGDGILDHEDRCPQEPGVAAFQGCRPPDTDGDGIIDPEDRCPDRPGVPAEAGCPPARAEIVQGRIDLKERVFFDTSKATIQRRSYQLLDDVAALLVANPGVTGIEIQGHTDDRGAADMNKALSQRRADAVKDYLVSKGVAADRLVAVGYGEEQPAEPNTTAAGRDANRRVEFVIRGIPKP